MSPAPGSLEHTLEVNLPELSDAMESLARSLDRYFELAETDEERLHGLTAVFGDPTGPEAPVSEAA